MFCFRGVVNNWSVAVGSSACLPLPIKNQTTQAHIACSSVIIFLRHIPPFQCHFPYLFSALLLHTLHFFTPDSLLSKPVRPLCCRLEPQVSVCVPARYATGLATEQAQELLPRTGASYRVQLICSNLLLWEVAAPGSTLLLYFSACCFLETSFRSLHSSTRIRIANWFAYELVRSYVFSSTVCTALFDSLSGLARQPLESEGVGVWGSGQSEVVSSRCTSQRDTEEVYDACFLPSQSTM